MATPLRAAEDARLAGPLEVVELLLRWDTAGFGFDPEYLRGRSSLFCYEQDGNCVGPGPGADRVSLMGSYEVRRLPDRGDTAFVAVEYDRLGWVDGAVIAFDSAMAVSDTVRLRRMDGAWRMVRSQLLPQLSPAAGLRLYATTSEDSMQMSRAARVPGSGPGNR